MTGAGSEADRSVASRHAADLLARVGIAARPHVRSDHPALGWRRAGLMAVTGHADGRALVAPVALSAAADGALAALRVVAPGAALPANGALLLGERARLLGLSRQGRTSANGSCRLVAARDGEVALNLARDDDRALLPAWLCDDGATDWPAVSRLAATRTASTLVARGGMLGLAVARSMPARPDATPFVVHRIGPARACGSVPLVIDLSGLWAGPLAGALLAAAGARVVKVESARRPDAARQGDGGFFDLLNAGKASVRLDFVAPRDVDHLRRLVAAADIVIEASRPRALAALGLDAVAEAARGATWLSITAHGRDGAAGERVGFGDDAAVAGGLAEAMRHAWGEPLFAGDAIADPLTGVTAAFAAWASWRQGGGRIVTLALADVVAQACALAPSADPSRWQALAEADTAPLYPLRAPLARARPLGADTAAILEEIG